MLSHQTMRSIVEQTMVAGWTHASVAAKFNVKAALVSRLVKQYKADASCFDEPTSKQRAVQVKIKAVTLQAERF